MVLKDQWGPGIFHTTAKSIATWLVAALFPRKCQICGVFGSMGYGGENSSSTPFPELNASFCPSCRRDFLPLESPLCTRCGTPFTSREGSDHLCGTCLLEEKHFTKARSFGVFKGSLMTAIHRFKYGKRYALAPALAGLVEKAFFRFWSPDAVDLVVPVPLHMKRLRERGFNQAYLLTRPWTKRNGLSCDPFILRRERWTSPQTAMTRDARRSNVARAFTVTAPEAIVGKRILLIDDVYTTGSTVDECARALMHAGAGQVSVLTLARAVS